MISSLKYRKGFTTKRDERQAHVRMCLPEASAGRKSIRGFTLIEAMVAVSILTLSIVGPLFTASRAIVAAQIARDQLTASYLAQEGIEYVRAMRDNEYLAAYPNNTSAAWGNFSTAIAGCRTTSPGTAPFCTFDPVAVNAINVCSGTCAPLWLSLNIYVQTQDVGTKTAFTRTIQTVSVTAIDEKIVSKVSWTFHGTPYSVTITDHLTPWQ